MKMKSNQIRSIEKIRTGAVLIAVIAGLLAISFVCWQVGMSIERLDLKTLMPTLAVTSASLATLYLFVRFRDQLVKPVLTQELEH